MSFKDISYLELWWPFCLVEQNHLCNFGRRYQEEQLFEIILNLDLIWSSGSSPVWWSQTICAILKQGIMGNIHVKLYAIWTSGLGGDVIFKKKVYGPRDDRQTTDED